jgi:hypothetical protein
MKQTLKDLRLHQRLKARVVEVQIGGDVVVAFGDELIRVKNSSDKILRVGDQLDLIVSGLRPIEFKLYQRPLSFDRTI